MWSLSAVNFQKLVAMNKTEASKHPPCKKRVDWAIKKVGSAVVVCMHD